MPKGRLLSAEIAGLAAELGATDRLFPQGTKNMFASLARSIAGQQLATAAAFKIHSRFVDICKVHSRPHAKSCMAGRTTAIQGIT